jgi:leader peptidase (prepilin peptidase) / N-methyltransferase
MTLLRALTKHYKITSTEIAICAAAGLLCALGVSYYAGAEFIWPSTTLFFLMSLITIIDAREMLIPDMLSLSAIPLGLLSAWYLNGNDSFTAHVLAAFLAAACFMTIRIAYQWLRDIEALGVGDVKLAGAAGAWLGLDALPMTCLLATCGALAAVIIQGLVAANKPDLKTAVPFGAFIAPAIIVIWFGTVLYQ